MNRDILIASAAKKLIDAPYSLGNKALGYDCISMIFEFYSALGVEFPKEFKGFTLDNYAERWKAGEGREEFMEFMDQFGEEVEVNFARAGDLIIFDSGAWASPGIYLGSGHVLCSFEKGNLVVPMKFFKHTILGVRRCLR